MNWEYFRKDFIEFMHDITSQFLANINGLTPIEKIAATELLYCGLRHGTDNVKTVFQQPIDKYIVDFVFETKFPFVEIDPLKIVIECDGHDFHEKTKLQASKDKERDRFLTLSGYKILRYSGSDIVKRPAVIGEDIDALILEYLKGR